MDQAAGFFNSLGTGTAYKPTAAAAYRFGENNQITGDYGEARNLIGDQKPLLRAIIDALLVLENSPADEIDSHVAVTAMESIASELLTLSHEDQRRLRAAFQEIATESQDVGYQEFVNAVPDMVNLAK